MSYAHRAAFLAPDEPVVGGRIMVEYGARVYVESWPAGGWVVRLQDHPRPVSRHDTREEAEFRAAAYQSVLERGHKLAINAAEHDVRIE